mmetsp:Transcript_69852/g.154543  ORF Transcript_69852/g.154543 Transcript_69852/m.154543 type:complete len:143 (+) Transcript_69852:100-528(+)
MPLSRTGSDLAAGQAATSTAGRLVIAPTSHLDPPFTRFRVDQGKVVDGGRYGRWAIGHGSGAGYWDRSSPESSRPSSSCAHQELASTHSMSQQKYLPAGLPFETSFSRVMAGHVGPRINSDVGKRSPMILTSAGVVAAERPS